ncbi:MAG TPA: hypothetical protein VGQ59_18035 [Cyclobacteriaceae bacterium]|jgi:hypothetical protein|nr:hypothetical protein [Cyclobacteriaceae bacterium]
MDKTTFEKVWELYMNSWSETVPEKRMKILEQILIVDCIDTDTFTHTVGREELSKYMAEFQKKVIGVKFITTHFKEHHNQSLAHWDMVDGQNKLITKGASFAMYNEENKLTQMNSFSL